MTTYYWYSEKQAAIMHGFHYHYVKHLDRPTELVLEEYKPLYIKGNQGNWTGLTCEYTSITHEPKPSGNWDDYALVAVIGPDTPIDIGELKWQSK